MEWSGLEARHCLELLSWKVDVEWCGLIFSECNQNPVTDFQHDIEWETLAASLGLVGKLPLTSPQISSSYGPVKVTGVVLLLGLGSYFCYKLYKVWLYQQYQTARINQGDNNSSSPPSSFAESAPAFSYHHVSNSSGSATDFLNIQTRYFGPMHLNNDDNYSGTEMTQCQVSLNQLDSSAAESQWRNKERQRRNRLSSPPMVYSNCLTNTRRGWLLHKLQSLTPGTQGSSDGDEHMHNKRCTQKDNNSTCTSSTGSSPISCPHQHSLSCDLSFDSLGLFNRTHREGSMDSMSSELSFDMPSFTEQTTENVTVTQLDKLQEEIDQLKSNCQLMDEEFETVKCNRNLPGLADLMETSEHNKGELTVEDIVKQQSAKACFKGLYSLTTINRSISMDLSIDEDSPQTSIPFSLTQLTEEEPLPSLEWDEEYNQDGDNNCALDSNNTNEMIIPIHSPASPNISSKLDTSGYDSKLDLSNSLTGSQFSFFDYPTSPVEELSDALNTELIRSMSYESYTENWSLTDSGSSDLDSPITDNKALEYHNNIGSRVDILLYAHQEWTGNTPKAKTILRGYKEIVDTFQYRYIRQIRGDNYCALRSAIFQTLAQGLSVPSGTIAMARLSKQHNIGSQWYQQWRFNKLPYTPPNILRGMEICLQSLDNISALLQSVKHTVEEREETLYNLFNTDPSLDLHIMEALKLHMMVTALDLHEAKGQDVPFFSILMFARDTSEMPLDFMNNHLIKVGDSSGLEQVEMFLLGYTLRVSLKVIRPSAHGTQQFLCYYPDDNVGLWPEVTLLAEDDRHYNILCT